VTSVPTDPDTFFDSYVRQSLSRIQSQLQGVSSPGAVVFRVGEREPVALRLTRGELEVSRETPADTLLGVTVDEADFEPILVRGAEALEASLGASDRQLAVFRALTLDAERAASIRAVPGSLAVELTGERTHRLVLTPGSRTPSAAAECTVRSALSDFWAMQRGQANPFELMMNGKIQISGDAQIVMVLSSLFM